jgi:pimeloyl-ACP methyl ester carboxylesterase
MTDDAITKRFRVIAFDLPFHGRSNPPDRWWLEKYRLTTATYIAFIRAVWQALGLDRPVVVGCSMGGAIVLKLAADYQRELRGIIGLESSAFAPGRYNEFLHHPAIHGGELAASYTMVCARRRVPSRARARTGGTIQSGRSRRLRRRRPFLQHRLGRPRRRQDDRHGRLQGLAADRRVRLLMHARHDTTGRRIDSRRADGDHERIGHFPMVENYPKFRQYLLPELDVMRERR